MPQFLIDFSEKSNKKESKSVMQLLSIKTETEEATEIIEEYVEEDLLMEEEKKKDNEISEKKNNTISKNNLSSNRIHTPRPTPTPTSIENTIIPGENPISDSIDEESDIKNIEQNIIFNKESEEEKIFITRLDQYKSVFNEGNINELEELISSCNKNSSSIEYKFLFYI